MSEKYKCYWTRDSYCSLTINESKDEIFIIGSCDSSRREFINTITEVIEKEFKMKSIFAEDLSEHNGYKAFCSNICSPIIKSSLVIVDLSAPIYNLKCSGCNQNIEVLQQSVNVYWEYGYACGLGKRILLLIDEEQINKMPFDVAGTQVEPYNSNNLREKLKKLIKLKLNEPYPPNRYNYTPPPLPPTPIGSNDHRIQPLIDLIKYKVVDYYQEIKPEKKKVIRKLIRILGTFNPIFLEKYGGGGGLVQIIDDYFDGLSLEQFRNRLDKKEIHIEMPRKSSLIIAGDFAFKVQKYINKNPDLNTILISKMHGEFDTEIRMHKFFPQNMSFDYQFLPALHELRNQGFIKGELYKDQSCKTEFIIPSQINLKRFIEIYSLDYYFQQHFNL